MAIAETRKYRSAQRDPTAIAYPKGRLVRRLAVAAVSMAILLAIQFKPSGMTAANELLWYGACLVAVLPLFWLILKDLHETSISVVSTHERFRRESENELKVSLSEGLAKKKKGKRR